MKLIVKKIDISTGDVLVGALNRYDAKKLDLHALDRIKIKKGHKVETIVVDISSKLVPRGKIGLFKEVMDSLKLHDGEIIEITPTRKPFSLDYIKKKLDGVVLTKEEIEQIVRDIVYNKLSDVELAYFVSACYANELTLEETTLLTKAMAKYGETLKLDRWPIMDKHCVGGVPGNRTTLIIVPIIAASGLTIPKTSSRSITSPAGTADTMEVLAKVAFNLKQMKKIIEETNGCIVWGGSLNLAPADDKIIRVERPLRIDARSELIASIMAKKLSVSATHLLVDIPTGKGTKLSSKRRALQLRKNFVLLGKRLKINVRVMITQGSEPIGKGIGPALEAKDALLVLRNDKIAPQDLKKKSLIMAGLMLEMGRKAKKGQGYKMAKYLLESGKAYEKMIEIIKAQQGKIIEPEDIKLGKYHYEFKAYKRGTIKAI